MQIEVNEYRNCNNLEDLISVKQKLWIRNMLTFKFGNKDLPILMYGYEVLGYENVDILEKVRTKHFK